MADTRGQKVSSPCSNSFRAATGKTKPGGSTADPGVGPRMGASDVGNATTVDGHDKENFTAGGMRIYSRRRSPLPSWYHRTPLRDVTAIVGAMDARRQKMNSLPPVRFPATEMEDGEVTPTFAESTSSPCTPVSCCPLNVFVDEVTPLIATKKRNLVRWRFPATVTNYDDKDKGWQHSPEKLNIEKLKDCRAKAAQRSWLMTMR